MKIVASRQCANGGRIYPSYVFCDQTQKTWWYSFNAEHVSYQKMLGNKNVVIFSKKNYVH